MGIRKTQRLALERAVREALVYGCTVHVDPRRPLDGKSHMRLIVTNPATGQWLVHTSGGTPRSVDAMVNGVGNAVRRKARMLVGMGPSG